MFKKWLSTMMILIGCGLILHNGYEWWSQFQLVERNPEKAKQIADDWEDTQPKEQLIQGESQDLKPHKGENVGQLVIPKLNAMLPIVVGTDEDDLEKGVGHYIGDGTVMIGETGHVVLSGHRDTVFRDVGKLQTGDRLYAKLKNGKTFTYQIRKSWITDADDRSVIVPHSSPTLSLTTCYPFDFLGSAPDRYIIRAELIDTTT